MKKIMFIIFCIILGSCASKKDVAKSDDGSFENTIVNSDYHRSGKEFLINIDYLERAAFRIPQKIKRGDYYRINVKNFNPNRYIVQINSKDTILSMPLKTPTFPDITIGNLVELTSGFIESTQSIITPNKISEDPLLLNKINSALHKMIDNQSQYPNESALIEEDVRKTFNENEKIIIKHQEALKVTQYLLDELKLKIYNYRLERYISIPDTNEIFEYEEYVKEFKNLRKEVASQQENSELAAANFKEYLSDDKVEAYLKNNKEAKERGEKVDKAYAEVKSSLEKFRNAISAEKIEKIIKSLIFLHTGKNEYNSFPIQFKGEQEELDISFIPKDSTSGLQIEKIPTIIFPVKRPIYWSIGTSFYLANLKNERLSYIVRPLNDNTDIYNITREAEVNRELGLSLNMRVGYKFKNNWDFLGIHLGFGPGISIDKNIRPRFLSGGGISLGNKHNLVIDIGGIFGYVDRISSSINLEEDFRVKPEGIITKTQTGIYYSLGYTYRL